MGWRNRLENVPGVGAGSRGRGRCEAAWRGGLVLDDDVGWAAGSRLASWACSVWAWSSVGPWEIGLEMVWHWTIGLGP